MTKPSEPKSIDKDSRVADRSKNPEQREAAPAGRRTRVPGVGKVAGTAAAPAKGAAGGAGGIAAGTAKRGRAAAGQVGGGTGRAAGKVAERGQAATGEAARGARRASAGAVERGRSAGEVARRTTTAAAETGGAAAGGVVSKGADVLGGVVGAVGPVLRSGVAASLSFVVARSLLLLQLIKRIALMALEAITNLLQRWLDRLASSGTPSDELDETDESS